MPDAEEPAQVSIAEVLELPPFLQGGWQMLTQTPALSRPVRWVHAIDDPKPAALLQGRELVLSTLSAFTEATPDLDGALRDYRNQLIAADAAGLAVEVLEDRPRLRQALVRLAAEPSSAGTAGLPILLFTEQVRFVQITEHFHRLLVSRQTDTGAARTSYDPLFEVSTQLISDILNGHITTADDTDRRTQPLGIAGPGQFSSLVVQLTSAATMGASERTEAQQQVATLARQAAAKAAARALVGQTPAGDIGVVLAHDHRRGVDAASRFSADLRRAAAGTRASAPLPVVELAAAGKRSSVLAAVHQLESAGQVLRSLEVIAPVSDQFTGFGRAAAERGYWQASDLGILGILSRVQDFAAIEWFITAQLGPLTGANLDEVRPLIGALARPTGTKAEIAAELGISRPTLYARILRLERLVGTPLDDQGIQALHAALLLADLHRRRS